MVSTNMLTAARNKQFDLKNIQQKSNKYKMAKFNLYEYLVLLSEMLAEE